MLKTRIITGIFLIAGILVGIFCLPPSGFVFVAGVLSAAMMHEWLNLIGVTHRLSRIILLDLFVLFEFLVYWFLPVLGPLFWIAAAFWALVLPLLIIAQVRDKLPKLNRTLLLFMGYFSVLAFFAGLIALREREQGQLLVLLAFLTVWCADSFAYAAGRLFGKHKLISKVSPGKTWEGLAGGLILTLIVLSFYRTEVLAHPIPTVVWFSGMIYLVIMSVLGDLFESLIKRMHEVKDSGTLLPGHGGLLDRFDSLMAVAPILTLLLIQGVL
jgi:phosphatidate cytidylyltransferase